MLLSELGEFKKAITGSAGMWVRCDDVQLVQFLHAVDPSNGDTGSHDPTTEG